MSKGSGKIGSRKVLAKRLGVAAAVLIAALMVLTAIQSGVVQGTVSSTVNLGSAGNFVILAKSGISTTGTTSIVGDLGVGPIDSTAITGFGLIMDSSNQFAISSLVTGKVYAADYASPTPTVMTTAISDMETAYTDAAGRVLPDFTELGAGNIDGMTLVPGLYKWGTGVTIPIGVTLTGGANDVWIFQIAQDLTVGNGAIVTLSGGAQAINIFWQVAGQVTLGTTSQFKGNILCKTLIEMNTGAKLNGRALAQTAVTLDANAITAPSRASDTTPPTVSSTIPAKATTGMAINRAVTATFSEAMDPLTITTDTFTLKQGTTPVSGVVTYTGATATFKPAANLTTSTVYTATITTGAKDLAGNALVSSYTWSFTTGVAPDITAPTVSSTVPAKNATGVVVTNAMSATFSEAMNPLTISTATFTLKQGVTSVSGAVTYSGVTAVFTPASNLAYSTVYTATITTGATDLAANALASNYVWSFTTSFTTGVKTVSIMCNISSQSITNGSSVTVSGAINAAVSAQVKIQTSTDGTTWNDLSTVTTASDGKYSYTWTPTATGTYKVRATWTGDTTYLGATSPETTLTASTEPQPDYTIYIIAVVAILAVAAGTIFILRRSKAKHS